MNFNPPEAVDCPCGEGEATSKDVPIDEPGNWRRPRTIVHYRHEGCPIGGTIVVESGRLVKRLGPLFKPERFGYGKAEGTFRPVAADGGVVEL